MRRRRIIANLLITVGIVLILYFLWLNFAGQIYQGVFTFLYDRGYIAADSEDFFTLDDLPDFLFFGQEVISTSENPAIEGDDGSIIDDGESPADGGEDTSPEEPEKPEDEGDEYRPIAYTSRKNYKSNDMRLVVPRLGVKTGVKNGTSAKALKSGPGLYDISDLPTDEGGRVVIAAHRDVFGSWFYNIDKLKKGDIMKVYFGDYIYVYNYEYTKIVNKTDWSITGKKDYAALILSSCHPKGTSKQRIFVVASLSEILPRGV